MRSQSRPRFLFSRMYPSGHGYAVRGAVQTCLVLLLVCSLVTPAHAAPSPLPASVYPPGTRLTSFPSWTNRQLDCNFGWFCEYNTPFAHLLREDELQRTGGWAMWGVWHHYRMGFELYASEYSQQPGPDGMSWNQLAAGDEELALTAMQGAQELSSDSSLIPAGERGGAFAASLGGPSGHILFLTVWWGTTYEVEAAVLCPVTKQGVAKRYLTAQVRMAIKVAIHAS